jgi:hypothetical protein
MQRRLLWGGALICLAMACGEATLTSSSQSKSTNKSSDQLNTTASKTLQSKSQSVSDIIRPVSISASQSLELAQFGTQTVDVAVQGHTPNGSLEIQPVTLTGFKVEFLTSSGAALSGPVALDADGKGKFKLKLTSEVVEAPMIPETNPPSMRVTAPGAVNGQILVQATDAGKVVNGSIPYKLSNVALVPMNVARVQDLPARFEFPAGTIPVFMNPSDRAVVEVMHFAGGGAGDARFKHQAQGPNNSMPAGRGYCPLNDGTTTVQVDPKQPIAPECLPCPADAAADLEGFFYDHRNEDSNLQRAIVCLKK